MYNQELTYSCKNYKIMHGLFDFHPLISNLSSAFELHAWIPRSIASNLSFQIVHNYALQVIWPSKSQETRHDSYRTCRSINR